MAVTITSDSVKPKPNMPIQSLALESTSFLVVEISLALDPAI